MGAVHVEWLCGERQPHLIPKVWICLTSLSLSSSCLIALPQVLTYFVRQGKKPHPDAKAIIIGTLAKLGGISPVIESSTGKVVFLTPPNDRTAISTARLKELYPGIESITAEIGRDLLTGAGRCWLAEGLQWRRG